MNEVTTIPQGSRDVSTPMDAYLDASKFNQLMTVAEVFSKSSLVPAHFRGKKEDCFIALQLAIRLGADPFAVMQNTYNVKGSPGMEAKMVIALINTSGLFKDRLEFKLEFSGESRQCKAIATGHNGKTYEAVYEFKTAKAEGLVDKENSKWKTMPDIMLQYRSATVFSRLYCPELLLGMAVVSGGEIIDGEIILEDRFPELQAPDDQVQPDPPEKTIDQMRAEYKEWDEARKEVFQANLAGFKDEGNSDESVRSDDECVRMAYYKTLKYT